MEKFNTDTLNVNEELVRDIIDSFFGLNVNMLMNSYTLENVALCKLQPKEKIPFDKYVEDLDLKLFKPYSFRDGIEGIAISSDGSVADKEWDFFAKECFVHNMNFLFATAPHKDDFDDNGLLLFKFGLNDYIMSLYPLFTQILLTNVEYGFFDLTPAFTDKVEESECYEKIAKFLVSIKVRKLRQGGCVDRYLKQARFIPLYVKKILKVQKNRYLLANSNTNSLEFKLALLSAFQFMNPVHSKLFELKIKKWIELQY